MTCFDIAENCEIYKNNEEKICKETSSCCDVDLNDVATRTCSFTGLALQARSHENSFDLAYIVTFVPWMCKKLP